MACDLTRGRSLECKDAVGGLQAVYFVNFGSDLTITYDLTDTDVIDQMVASADTVTAYKYELKGANSLEQNVQTSRDNGTTYWEQVLNLTLTKMTKEDHKELKLLCYGRPYAIVVDYNLNAFVCGLEHGMDVTGGTIVTGQAMGDLSGYTLTLTGMELKPANFAIPATAYTTPDTLMTELGFTVSS